MATARTNTPENSHYKFAVAGAYQHIQTWIYNTVSVAEPKEEYYNFRWYIAIDIRAIISQVVRSMSWKPTDYKNHDNQNQSFYNPPLFPLN